CRGTSVTARAISRTRAVPILFVSSVSVPGSCFRCPDADDLAARRALRRRVAGSVSTNEASLHRLSMQAVRLVQPPDHHLRPLARDCVEAKLLGFAAAQNTRCCDHERGPTLR